MNKSVATLTEESVALLKELIATPSFSKEEDAAAELLIRYMAAQDVETKRVGNNVIAFNQQIDAAKPTVLLNSHHDTVKPNKGYTRDPFQPLVENGKLFGLGSNDAGGCLVSLLATFLHFYAQPGLTHNLVFAATAEEEISGTGGVQDALKHLPEIAFGVVGEPTLMQMAVAERGLLVLDCVATGKAGHAARDEGENALYKAITDIEQLRSRRFEKVSDLLGPVKISVTSIETENKAHNVVPAECRFTADVRVNELYTLEEVLDDIRNGVQSTVTPRSTRLRSSGIALHHPLVVAGKAMGKTWYGSPTTSDKALMPFETLKMGPGDSARSHSADEFIYVDEIAAGIKDYIRLLEQVIL